MEKQQGGENLQGPKPEAPRLVFPIAGKEVNIADALSGDPARSKGLNYRDIADKAGAAGRQAVHELYKVRQRSRKAVQPPDDKDIPWLHTGASMTPICRSL